VRKKHLYDKNLIKYRISKGWKFKVFRDREDSIELQRAGRIAGEGYESAQAVEILLHHNYNGSGSTSFGGANEWPALKLEFYFPAGDYDSAYELASLLTKVCDKFSKEKGLLCKNSSSE